MTLVILLADNDSVSLPVLKRMVSRICPNHVVLVSTFARSFYNIITENDNISCLMTDIMWMSYKDSTIINRGTDLIESIRQWERDASVERPLPIVAISSDEKNKEKAMAVGASWFMTKPIQPNQLTTVLTALGVI